MTDPIPPVPTPGQNAPSQNAVPEAASAAPARTPWYRGPLIAIPILGVVLVAVVVAIPLTVAAVSAPQQAHPSAAPAPAKTGSTNSCWDGSSAAKGCPQLTGLAGLRWVFHDQDPTKPASCSKDTKDFTPSGAIEVYSCYWTDLPHTVAYVARYDGVAASQQDWSDYMKTTYGAKTGRMTIDTTDAGIYIDGTTTDGTNTTSEEEVYGYDAIPFYVDVYTDYAAGGTADQQKSIMQDKLTVRSVKEVKAAITSAK